MEHQTVNDRALVPPAPRLPRPAAPRATTRPRRCCAPRPPPWPPRTPPSADRYLDPERAGGGAAGRPRGHPPDLRRRCRGDRHRAGHRPVRLHPGVVRGHQDRHPDPRLPLRRAGRAQPGRAGQRPGARPRSGPTCCSANDSLALDRGFKLTSAFEPLEKYLKAGQLGFVPAVSDPRLSRSHFQAADACNLGGLPGETGGRGWLDSLVDDARHGHRVPQRRHRQHAAPLAGRHQRRDLAEQRRLAAAQRRPSGSGPPPRRPSRASSPASTTRSRSRCSRGPRRADHGAEAGRRAATSRPPGSSTRAGSATPSGSSPT